MFEKSKALSLEAELSRLKGRKMAILLCHGGSFSLAIFDEKDKCIFRKSDKRYVVRKKQGGRQLQKDKVSGKKIKSVGSGIRRANEEKHQHAIHEIVKECADLLNECAVIAAHAPGINKQILVGKGQAFHPYLDKMRQIAINTKKANFTEVEKVHGLIGKVYYVFNV